MATSNLAPVTLDTESIERFGAIVDELCTLQAQLGTLKLAIGGMWFADTELGKGCVRVNGAVLSDVAESIARMQVDLSVQINELETLPELFDYIEKHRGARRAS